MKELGPLIKAAREQRAVTIREAEELSGISNAYLSQLENGKIQKPSPETLNKLSKLYQIPYEMLMEKAGYPLPDYGLVAGNDTDHIVSILIVDDSPHDRELIRSHLENDPSHGYTFFEAETGTEALDQISKHKPDCVLLDYRLPDIDGLTVFEQIKRIDSAKDVSVIIMTGHGNEETAVRAMRMGAVNYLNKNLITLERLVVTIRHAVRRKKLRESLGTAPARPGHHHLGLPAVVPGDLRHHRPGRLRLHRGLRRPGHPLQEAGLPGDHLRLRLGEPGGQRARQGAGAEPALPPAEPGGPAGGRHSDLPGILAAILSAAVTRDPVPRLQSVAVLLVVGAVAAAVGVWLLKHKEIDK